MATLFSRSLSRAAGPAAGPADDLAGTGQSMPISGAGPSKTGTRISCDGVTKGDKCRNRLDINPIDGLA